MARITWDALGERKYEIGVDRGVFYPWFENQFTNGVAWNGLTGVDDNSANSNSSSLYSGDVKSVTEYSQEEYSGKIRCYTYPDEFEEFLGVSEISDGVYARQQERGLFGFCYRTLIGSDTDGTDHGYKLHLVYNMTVTDFSRSYSTVNDSPEIQETEISFETYPYEFDDVESEYDAVSEIVIDSRKVTAKELETLENILYGEESPPRLPYPDEILEMFETFEPVPEEWILFPNFLIHPSHFLYPVSQEEDQEG